MNSFLSLYLIQDFAVILITAAVAAWLCRRVGLSPIVGYLVGGIIVGTPQITFIYVTDPIRVQLLSQLGLIFLMFSIGLSFRVQRFKQLGVGMVVAAFGTALLVLTLTRFLAGLIGFSQVESLFLAAMLMVSSSAVIGKTLQSTGSTHRRFGQLALGITLCEDIVAIVLLGFLGSYVALEPGETGNWMDLAMKVGMLLAFVALLLIPGLILVPRLLERLWRKAGESNQELETLVVAGLLFGMAYLTVMAGYSLALGAFLCGMIVAESSRGRFLSETFTGLRDIFVAVFFVAIGMAIDVTYFPSAIGLIALGSGLALLLRPLASSIGLLIACERPNDAVRAGLCLTPIGEFSFVIAGLGVSSGVLNERYQIAAVGVSFVTMVISPWIIARSERIANAVNPSRISMIDGALTAYRNLWEALDRQQESSLIWKLLRPRIPQVAGELLFVSALLVFSVPIYRSLEPKIASAKVVLGMSYEYGYWILITLLTLAPLIALARNINAIAMLLGDYLTRGRFFSKGLRSAVTLLIRVLGLLALGVWILNLIPFSWLSTYSLISVSVTILVALAFGWRVMVRLHSEAAFSLHESIAKEEAGDAQAKAFMLVKEDWDIELEEVRVDNLAISGRAVGELRLRERSGATVVGIERQQQYLPAIGPNTLLFAGDRLFVTGSHTQLAKLRELLASDSNSEIGQAPDYSAAILETSIVQSGSAVVGKTLKTLQWPRLHGVQVVSMRQQDGEIGPPDISEPLVVGDAMLLVGEPRSLANVKKSLETTDE